MLLISLASQQFCGIRSKAEEQGIKVFYILVESAVSQGTVQEWYDSVLTCVSHQLLNKHGLNLALDEYRAGGKDPALALFLFDEMQMMFTNCEVKNAIKTFLMDLIDKGIPYIGFGTFILQEL